MTKHRFDLAFRGLVLAAVLILGGCAALLPDGMVAEAEESPKVPAGPVGYEAQPTVALNGVVAGVVGTGVLVAPDRVEDIRLVTSEEKDVSHIWLITSSDRNGELSFRAGFAWEAAGEITSFKAWKKYLGARAAH